MSGSRRSRPPPAIDESRESREWLALELPNETAPDENFHFVVRLDGRMSAEELSDAIVAAAAGASARYVTLPLIERNNIKRVAAIWDAQRQVVPLAQVLREVDRFACTQSQANEFVHGAQSTKVLRAVQGMCAFGIAPPPVDPARRLLESCKEQLEIEIPLEIARGVLEARHASRQKQGEPPESLDESVMNAMVRLAAIVTTPRSMALYAADRARWRRELDAALDPRRARGWRAAIGLVVYDPVRKQFNWTELAALLAVSAVGIGLVSGAGVAGLGELLLVALCLVVLGVRAQEVLQAQADAITEDVGADVTGGGGPRELSPAELEWRRLAAPVAVGLLASALTGTLAAIGRAAVRSLLTLSESCRHVCVLLLGSAGSSTLGVVGNAVLIAVAAWRSALRAHLASMFMHAPRFIGGLQLPADPEENREAMLAACDHATGSLHAPGFWTHAVHWQECRELLQRRVRGLAVFAEHAVLLLLVPVLMRACWALVRLRPWTSLARSAWLQRSMAALVPMASVAAACFALEQMIVVVANEVPAPPLATTLAGAAVVLAAWRSIMAVKVTIKTPATSGAPAVAPQ